MYHNVVNFGQFKWKGLVIIRLVSIEHNIDTMLVQHWDPDYRSQGWYIDISDKAKGVALHLQNTFQDIAIGATVTYSQSYDA
jgi:hypothetical protein